MIWIVALLLCCSVAAFHELPAATAAQIAPTHLLCSQAPNDCDRQNAYMQHLELTSKMFMLSSESKEVALHSLRN
jgi:hypothetical protein